MEPQVCDQIDLVNAPVTPPAAPPRVPNSVSPKILEPAAAAAAKDASEHAKQTFEEMAKANAELKELTMPAAGIRRIARAGAPECRFSSEALAALHRVGQAFVCYATDRILKDMVAEDKAHAAKKKGKHAAPTGRKMSADHVMHFLSAELPAVASKIGMLFYEDVPAEYRPEPIRLLEQLRMEEEAAAAKALVGEDSTSDATTDKAGGADSGGAGQELGLGDAAGGKRQQTSEDAAAPQKKRAKTAPMPTTTSSIGIVAALGGPRAPSLSSMFRIGRKVADSDPPASASKAAVSSVGGTAEAEAAIFGGFEQEELEQQAAAAAEAVCGPVAGGA